MLICFSEISCAPLRVSTFVVQRKHAHSGLRQMCLSLAVCRVPESHGAYLTVTLSFPHMLLTCFFYQPPSGFEVYHGRRGAL